MSREKLEPKTQDLVASTAEARDRVATDLEQLAQELTPAHLKARAVAGAGVVVWRLAVGRHRSR
jgi:hypothetical protein